MSVEHVEAPERRWGNPLDGGLEAEKAQAVQRERSSRIRSELVKRIPRMPQGSRRWNEEQSRFGTRGRRGPGARSAPSPVRQDVLAIDLLEKRIFRQHGQAGEPADDHGEHGKGNVPKVVEDPLGPREIRPVVRRPGPRSGNQSRKLPPAKRTTRRTANRKPGIAYPTMTNALVHTSKSIRRARP